jgi:hypothetical protein
MLYDQKYLADEIHDQLQDGKENLHVILWVNDRGIFNRTFASNPESP